MMKQIFILLGCVIFLCNPDSAVGQKQTLIRLGKLQQKGKLRVVNRKAALIQDSLSVFLRVSEGAGEGLVWLPRNNFSSGKLSFVIRGKDLLQRSFVGIAFHGVNDSTYDAVYCRPFNFFAKDSVRRIHAIQYIAHPAFTWKKLREEQNAIFEKEIPNPPDPNGWFTLTLMVTATTVEAYINDAAKPALTVKKLSTFSTGKVGFFVGDGSGGDLKISDKGPSNN